MEVNASAVEFESADSHYLTYYIEPEPGKLVTVVSLDPSSLCKRVTKNYDELQV